MDNRRGALEVEALAESVGAQRHGPANGLARKEALVMAAPEVPDGHEVAQAWLVGSQRSRAVGPPSISSARRAPTESELGHLVERSWPGWPTTTVLPDGGGRDGRHNTMCAPHPT